MNRILSKYNNTNNILSSNGIFTGLNEKVVNYDTIIINILSNQNSAVNGIEVYFGSLLKGIKIIDNNTFNFNKICSSKHRGLWKMLNLTYLSKIGNSLKQAYEKENNFV